VTTSFVSALVAVAVTLVCPAGSLNAEGPVSHYLGGLATVLGRYNAADAHFTQASAFNERLHAAFFAARTNLSWGKMLAERNAPGDADKARDLLTKAHAVAVTNGYRNVERRAKHDPHAPAPHPRRAALRAHADCHARTFGVVHR
jgi:hypothetical protein